MIDCEETPPVLSTRHVRSAGLAVVCAFVTALPGAASAAPAEPVPRGTPTVDGQATPVHASFRYRLPFEDEPGEVRGLVHAVQRIDGGTLLYYSIGMTGAAGDASRGCRPFPDSSHPYELNTAVDLSLLDPTGLTGYRPLAAGRRTFATRCTDLDGEYGTLRVGWAAFPELPAGVTSVQVLMPYGTAAGEVPVGNGALTPTATRPAPLPGQGWPAPPPAADLKAADPRRFTFAALRRTGDARGTALIDESTAAVAVTLDAGVLFDSDSAELSSEARKVLTGVAADIAARGTGRVEITGHTDSDGSDSDNLRLSRRRAEAVLAALRPAAGTGVTFRSSGRGEAEPVASNATAAGKPANRRVTVRYALKGN